MRTRSRWITLGMIIGAAIVLLAFTACGGGGDNSSNTPKASSTASNNGGSSSTSGATQTEQPSASTDILDQLTNLGKDIQAVTGKVTYKSTSSDGSTSTITFYSKPPNSRFDTVESDGTTTAYIETASATYICTGSENTCIQSPLASGGAASGLGILGSFFSPALVDALVSAAKSQGIDISRSSETIAGNDATCFSGSDSQGSGKFCFSGSGVLLYEETTDSSGTQKLEATSYSSDVPDSDFEPPYPVTTIPSLGQ